MAVQTYIINFPQKNIKNKIKSLTYNPQQNTNDHITFPRSTSHGIFKKYKKIHQNLDP